MFVESHSPGRVDPGECFQIECFTYYFSAMSHYKVLKECLSVGNPSEAYTCDSFSFDHFDDAFDHAKSWAEEDWGEGNFYEFPSGHFSNKDSMIWIQKT
jgi:hypothetical protein